MNTPAMQAQIDEHIARWCATNAAMTRRKRWHLLTGRTFLWHLRKRFPNIKAMERDRSDLYAELVQDRSAPVRDVIRELSQDITWAKERSWPRRLVRIFG